MSEQRKTLDQLAEELEAAHQKYGGERIIHVKSGSLYRIVGFHFRESDMALCVEYTPRKSDFYNRVKFARSVEEMDFGNRFVFGVSVTLGNSELDGTASNHFDHHKRGFDPK